MRFRTDRLARMATAARREEGKVRQSPCKPALNPCRVIQSGAEFTAAPTLRTLLASHASAARQSPLLLIDHSPLHSTSLLLHHWRGRKPSKSLSLGGRASYLTAGSYTTQLGDKGRRRNGVLTRIVQTYIVLTVHHLRLTCNTRRRVGKRSGHLQPQPRSRLDSRGADTPVTTSGPVPATW